MKEVEVPLYCVFQEGELKEMSEHETAYVAHIHAERDYGDDYVLLVVVGRQPFDKVMRHLQPKEKPKPRRK